MLGSSFSFASTRAILLLLTSATIEVVRRPVDGEVAASAWSGASLRATRMRWYPRFARRSA